MTTGIAVIGIVTKMTKTPISEMLPWNETYIKVIASVMGATVEQVEADLEDRIPWALTKYRRIYDRENKREIV